MALPAAVLLADPDLFQAGYVRAVLAKQEVTVVGPFDDYRAALAAVEGQDLSAGIVAHEDGDDACTRLIAALEDRRIPCLTLRRTFAVAGTGAGRPVLTRPFAAYQVATWVRDTLGGISGAASTALAEDKRIAPILPPKGDPSGADHPG